MLFPKPWQIQITAVGLQSSEHPATRCQLHLSSPPSTYNNQHHSLSILQPPFSRFPMDGMAYQKAEAAQLCSRERNYFHSSLSAGPPAQLNDRELCLGWHLFLLMSVSSHKRFCLDISSGALGGSELHGAAQSPFQLSEFSVYLAAQPSIPGGGLLERKRCFFQASHLTLYESSKCIEKSDLPQQACVW